MKKMFEISKNKNSQFQLVLSWKILGSEFSLGFPLLGIPSLLKELKMETANQFLIGVILGIIAALILVIFLVVVIAKVFTAGSK